MRRAIILLGVLALVCGSAHAKTEVSKKLVVELDRKIYGLYENVTGKVKDLDVGEKFTLELADAYGKVHVRLKMKRKGRKGTPFRLPIRWFSTSEMYVFAKSSTNQSGG